MPPTTLIDFIVAQSTLPIGNTVRDHIENPSTGGGPGGYLVLADGLDVGLDESSMHIRIKSDKMRSSLAASSPPVRLELDNAAININQINDQKIVIVQSDKYSISINDAAKIHMDGEMIYKTAATNISGNRLVITDSAGEVLVADKDSILDGKRVIGLTTQAVVAGARVGLAISGNEVSDSNWTWNIDKPIYLGDDGFMTQIPPTEGFILIAAVPLTATSIRIRIEMPIFL